MAALGGDGGAHAATAAAIRARYNGPHREKLAAAIADLDAARARLGVGAALAAAAAPGAWWRRVLAAEGAVDACEAALDDGAGPALGAALSGDHRRGFEGRCASAAGVARAVERALAETAAARDAALAGADELRALAAGGAAFAREVAATGDCARCAADWGATGAACPNCARVAAVGACFATLKVERTHLVEVNAPCARVLSALARRCAPGPARAAADACLSKRRVRDHRVDGERAAFV